MTKNTVTAEDLTEGMTITWRKRPMRVRTIAPNYIQDAKGAWHIRIWLENATGIEEVYLKRERECEIA